MCLCVFMWILNCSGEYHVCLTVWYVCTQVACDSSYTLSTVRRLKETGPFVETPRIFLCMQNINYAEILA